MTAAQSRAVRARGAKAAEQIAQLFAVDFPGAERRALHGAYDRGDIINVIDLAIEAKAVKVLSLGTWVDEAMVEAINAKVTWHVVAHKRKSKGQARDWFATMNLSAFVKMYCRLQFLEAAERLRQTR